SPVGPRDEKEAITSACAGCAVPCAQVAITLVCEVTKLAIEFELNCVWIAGREWLSDPTAGAAAGKAPAPLVDAPVDSAVAPHDHARGRAGGEVRLAERVLVAAAGLGQRGGHDDWRRRGNSVP